MLNFYNYGANRLKIAYKNPIGRQCFFFKKRYFLIIRHGFFDEKEVVTAGQAVKAMVMCGLGFTHRPMMLTPQFFSNLAVDELIGAGIKAEDLNRHKLGRTLDALSEKGVEGIFSVLASKACAMSAIDQSAQSLDTTSFSLTGEYDVAFILSATRMDQLRSVALGGEIMPQKSTYFYPKVLSGLVFRGMK